MSQLVPVHPRHRAAILLLGAVVSGCGATHPAPRAPSAASPAGVRAGASGSTSRLRSTFPGLPQRPSRTGRARGPAPVGTPQTVAAPTGRLLVTVTAVLDPLRDAGAALPAGDRPVGVPLELRVLSGSYDSTASGDVVLRTAGGAAAPAFVSHGTCATQTVDFESEVSAGEQRAGCVAFAVPGHARVIGVGFRPDARATGEAVWALRAGSGG